ncbi:unnamed protein product [Closterium sp. NIES-53]
MGVQRAAKLAVAGIGVALAIVSCCYMADNYLVISHPSLCSGVSNATLCSQEFRAARRQLSVIPQTADQVTAAMVSAVAAQVSAIIDAAAEIKRANPADVEGGAKWLDDDFVAQLRHLQAELNALGDGVHEYVARRELRRRHDDDDDDDDDDEDKKDKKSKKKKGSSGGSGGGSSKNKNNKSKSKGSGVKPSSGPIRASKGLKANAVVKGKIQSAIDAAPGGSQYVIYIPAGTYREQVVIDTPDIILIGAGAGATVITYDESYGSGSSTFDSATVGVNSDRFVAFGIKFVNTAGPENHQAVAFRATGDQSAAIDCAFEGSQDTLYVDAGRQFYSNCYIGGTQDFIFGDAAAVIQNAKIQLHPSKSFITLTASGRAKDTPTGIVIRDSVVSADKGTAKAYLGRPWKKCAFTVFVNVMLPAVIQPDGWLSWNEGSCMFLAEAGSKGPGAKASRADWVDPGIISNGASYTAAAFAEVNSWLILS